MVSQVLATTIKNIHLIDLGLIMAMPGIVIPALSGIQNEHNRDEFLTITSTQSSWMSE